MSLLLLFSGRGSAPVVIDVPPSLELDDFSVELALNGSYHDAVLEDSPVGFYLLGEHLGTTAAKDRSGNDQDATYVGGMTFGHRGPFPHGGTSIALNGTTGYVNAGDVAAYEFTGAFSIEFLVKFTNAQFIAYLVSKGFSDIPNGWRVNLEDGQLRFTHTTLVGGTIFAALSPATYNDGEWHHVVCTWDGTTGANKVKIYVDGAVVRQVTASAGTPGAPSTARAIIGGVDQTGSAVVNGLFDGSLVGVALYNTELSAARVTAHYDSLQWTDVTEDVLASGGLTLEYGTRGTKPLDRLANAGVLEFDLDNSEHNSVELAGYYSPNHVNARSGFGFDIPIRVRMTYNDDTHDRFWGRIAVIEPEPGQDRSRVTHVLAYDYVFILTDTDVREILPQLGKTETELIRTVFDALPYNAQPMALELDTAIDTYTYAFDDIQGGVRAATALNKVIVSAWGRGFVYADGTFRYRNRQATIGEEIEMVIDDEMLLDLQSPSDRSAVFNHVRVVTHPRDIDPTATAVLYSHPTAPFVPPGGVLEFFGDYRNPNNTLETVGGTDMVDPPVSGTDFIAHEFQDGTGTVLTGSVTATADFFNTTVKWRLVNNHATLGAYFTTLEARGRGIYDQAPVTSEAPIGALPGSRSVTLDLKYQDDANTGQALAEFILNEREAIIDPIESITVDPHHSVELMGFAVECEPGELLAISETQTGLNEAQALIRSIRVELIEGGILTLTIGLLPVLVGDVWEMDVDALDSTTVLGYA